MAYLTGRVAVSSYPHRATEQVGEWVAAALEEWGVQLLEMEVEYKPHHRSHLQWAEVTLRVE